MTGSIPRPEILPEPQRRRRWSPAEKLAMVEATYDPGVRVSLVARRNGIQPNPLFAWRKLVPFTAPTQQIVVLTLPNRRPSCPE